MNYKQIHARQKAVENKIIKAFGDPTENSGVYVFTRFSDEKQKDCYYVGQAKNLKRRLAQHLLEYDHIAISLKKHGLFDKSSNPNGWGCTWEFCSETELDELEQNIIAKYYLLEDAEIYNITSGGQAKGKVDINPRAERKGYNKGKEEGYKKAYAEIAILIKKYTNGLTSKGTKIADRKTAELARSLMCNSEESGENGA